MKKTCIYWGLALLLSSCSGGKNANTEQENSTNQQDTAFHAVVMPEIPAMMTAPEQRAEFLATHYWDGTDFSDTSYVNHREAVEQAWVDYLAVLYDTPLETARQLIDRFFLRISNDKKLLNHFGELADRYLYDPNSPMRNEELYMPVLEAMINSSVLDEAEKMRPEFRLELARKNRIGTRAANFTYTLASGAKGTLYQVPADYTLLFINNPGCHACAETIAQLKEDARVNMLLKAGKLTVLSFYPDEELDEWRKHQNDFPSEWINGYDSDFVVKTKNVYDLKAIPTLYLLDRNKIVILKDAPLQVIDAWLLQNVQ